MICSFETLYIEMDVVKNDIKELGLSGHFALNDVKCFRVRLVLAIGVLKRQLYCIVLY